MQKLRQHPILILIVINLLIGLMTFRSYGLTWDEPLFYEYGQASLYAYTPANWFSPNFDIARSFGASASDHANRGPAYLILAAPLHLLLTRLGLDTASAWHLINFLTFNLGIYLLYRLASKWMSRESAFTAAALFALQPLLWGHAFINPKDIPFLTFFLGASLMGVSLAGSSPARPLSLTAQSGFDWALGIAIFAIGILSGLSGQDPMTTIFLVGFGAAHLALTVSTRYSARGA